LRCINWKDIKPRWEMISELPNLNDIEVNLEVALRYVPIP